MYFCYYYFVSLRGYELIFEFIDIFHIIPFSLHVTQKKQIKKEDIGDSRISSLSVLVICSV